LTNNVEGKVFATILLF